MLFWLGSYEFDTPWGRFILTSALNACWGRRRAATKEEAAQVWSSLEMRLWTASYDELLPLYELYEALTSEPHDGTHCPPHRSLVLDAIRHALWAKQLQLQFEAAFGPPPEPEEWEPPPLENLAKRIPSQSPSEIWGRGGSPPKKDVYFKVQLVDETGQSIPDVKVTFTHDGKEETDTTNGQGVVEYAGSGESTASVFIESLDELESVLDERWQVLRPLKLLEGDEVSRLTLKKAGQATTLTDAQPRTIQIVPQLGCIHVELVDKTNQVRHANRKYAITGPKAYAGVTNDDGILRHDDVLKGDYKLKLALDNETYDCDLVVLENDDERQFRMVGAAPRSSMASVRGFVFEKNKAFVMPAAIDSMQEVRSLFFSTAPNEILIVGHADTTAEPPINDPLSLSRADCAQAMLLGDVDAWLKMYTTSVKEKHRWGAREDGLMIGAMPDFDTKPKSEGPVWWYQRTRGLKQDGDCGKNTRTQLITEYMALVGEPLKSDPDFRAKLTTHGCGENFPLDAAGENVDPNPANPIDDPGDRRVEFFFFDVEYGIQPPATTKNSQPGSTEYPEWREGVSTSHIFDPSGITGPRRDFWVRLDLSKVEAPDCNDEFLLESTCGRYSQTRKVASTFEPNETTVDLCFKLVPDELTYRLWVIPADGTTRYLLEGEMSSEAVALGTSQPGPQSSSTGSSNAQVMV